MLGVDLLHLAQEGFSFEGFPASLTVVSYVCDYVLQLFLDPTSYGEVGAATRTCLDMHVCRQDHRVAQ